MASKILIVDGSDADRSVMVQLLADARYELDDAPDGIEAFEKILAQPYDLVVTEAKLERLDGPDLIPKLRAHGVKTPVLVLTSVTKAATLAALMKLGIVDYVHKASPPEAIRQKIAAALPAAPQAIPAEASTGAVRAPAPSGGILLVDAADVEHRRLRALVPETIPFDGCKTFNEALARARSGHYRMIVLDSDASVLNLGGIVAQVHVLQPEAAVIAAVTIGKNADRATVLGLLDTLGFDDVVCKPFVPEEIALLVERRCATWQDLVGVKEDVIQISRMRCRRDHQKRYLYELTTRIESALSGLSNACFDRAILNLTRAEQLAPADAAELLARFDQAAAGLGVMLVAAVPAALATGLRAFKDSFAGDRFRWFASADEARASLG